MTSWRATLRLVRSELRGRRLRSMSLFLVVVTFAAAAIVAGVERQSGAGDQWDETFAEANGAHVTLFGDRAKLEELALDARVSDRTRPYRTTGDRDLTTAAGTTANVVVRELGRDDLPAIARPLLRTGRWIAPGAADEIVVDRGVAIDEGLRTGDRVRVDAPSGPATFTIVGTAIDLVDCFYPDCDPAATWVDPAGAARLFGADDAYVVFLRLRDADAAESFVVDMSSAGVGTADWNDTRTDALAASTIFSAFLQAFGLFVMLAGALVVAGTMAARALARRRDVGVLKAVGCTPRQVGVTVVVAHALAAAVGTTIGWLVGSAAAESVQLQLAKVLGRSGISFHLQTLLFALVAIEAIVVISVALPAWRAGRVPTVNALATVPSRASRRVAGARVFRRLRVPPVAVAGFRDAFSRPARSVLTGLALAIAVIAVLVSVGTRLTIDSVFDEPAVVGNPEELQVYAAEGRTADAVRAVEAAPEVVSWFGEDPFQVGIEDEQVLGVAMTGDVARSGFVVRDGRMFASAGEAIVGYGFLDRFGVAVGDSVAVIARGAPLTLRIVGWYGESEDSGDVIRFAARDLEAVTGQPMPPSWLGVNLEQGADAAAVARSLDEALDGGKAVPVQDDPGDEMDTFLAAFALVAALVLVVAAANLSSTMTLAVRERSHDLGVLRAVGATPRQTIAVVSIGAATIAIVAVVVGIPAALVIGNALNDTVGELTGMGPGIGDLPGVGTLVAVAVATIAVAAALGAAVARRPARAAVSDLVRYE